MNPSTLALFSHNTHTLPRPPPSTEHKPYTGACHCRAIEFQCYVGPHERKTALYCNCSMCTRKGITHIFIDPPNFVLTKGSLEHATQLYTFGTGTAKHFFCKTCGIHPFYIARTHQHQIDVNARCLDEWEQLSKELTVSDFNGQDWEKSNAELHAKQ